MDKKIRKNLEQSIQTLTETLALYQNVTTPASDDVVPFLEQLEKRRKYMLNVGTPVEYENSNLVKMISGKVDPRLSTILNIVELMGCHLELVPNS